MPVDEPVPACRFRVIVAAAKMAQYSEDRVMCFRELATRAGRQRLILPGAAE
jgi:hypothetical protein